MILFNPELGDKGFLMGFSPKMNAIERLDSELTFFEATVQPFYTTGTPTCFVLQHVDLHLVI